MQIIDTALRFQATIVGACIGLIERWLGLTRISKLLHGRAISGSARVIPTGHITYLFNHTNVQKHRLASTSGISAVRLQGMVMQVDPASDESSSQEIDEQELAELLRLAEEYKTECAARRAALDAREAATPASIEEEVALLRIAAEFNKDRTPGILQLARHGVALPAEMEVTADPSSFTQIQKHEFPGLPQIDIQTDMMGVPDTGGTVWPAGGALAAWLAQQQLGASDCCSPFDLRSIRSVLELGTGTGETRSARDRTRRPPPCCLMNTHSMRGLRFVCRAGLLSIALAKLGVARVVATDGDEAACELCRANAAANCVGTPQLHVVRLRWGSEGEEAGEMKTVLSCFASGGEGGKSDGGGGSGGGVDDDGGGDGCFPELVVAADVWYMDGEAQVVALERSVRDVITRGARFVLFSSCARSGIETTFLQRLADLGEVSEVWHGCWKLNTATINLLRVRVTR